jgi:hypothetical protein
MYSYDCLEPQPVHVDREDKSAKFWLEPVVMLASNYGYNRAELRKIERLLQEQLTILQERWKEFCGHHSRIT